MNSMSSRFDTHITDDDAPKRPDPADDSLSSAQSRRYWRQVQQKAVRE